MNISEIGEFGFIERFSTQFNDMRKTDFTGIGDDCAILPLDGQFDQVVTTDLLIENIHFIIEKISPFDLGYKSLAVNLSDIAAMGAEPTASFLSIALPPTVDVEFMDLFMKGYHQLSKKYGVPLLGGDTTKSPDNLVINVCVLGKVLKGKACKRSDAQPDDLICVTGPLGDSAAGLKMLLNNIEADNHSKPLINWHNCPEPAINEGLWLGRQEAVHAMMDISDGVASDLNHILKSSEAGATIQIENTPISEALDETSQIHKWNSYDLALTGGEDYRLLLTIDNNEFKNLAKLYNQLFAQPLTPIGTITSENTGKIKWTKKGIEIEYNQKGFNHF